MSDPPPDDNSSKNDLPDDSTVDEPPPDDSTMDEPPPDDSTMDEPPPDDSTMDEPPPDDSTIGSKLRVSVTDNSTIDSGGREFVSPRSNRPPPTLKHTNSTMLQNVRGNLKKTEKEKEQQPRDQQRANAPVRGLIRGQSLLTPVPAKVRGLMRPSVAEISSKNDNKRSVAASKDNERGPVISRLPSNSELNAGLDGIRTLNLPIHKRKLSMSAVKTRHATGAGQKFSSSFRVNSNMGSIDEAGEVPRELLPSSSRMGPRGSNTKFLFSLGEIVEESDKDGGEIRDDRRGSQTLLPFQSQTAVTNSNELEPTERQDRTQEDTDNDSRGRQGRNAFRQSGELGDSGLTDEAISRLKILSRDSQRQDMPEQREQDVADDLSLISSLSGGSSMFQPKPNKSKSFSKDKGHRDKKSQPPQTQLHTQVESLNEDEMSGPQPRSDKKSHKALKTKDKIRTKKKKTAEQMAKEAEEREATYQKALQEEHERWLIRPKKHPDESILMRLFTYVENEEEDKTKSTKKKKKKKKKKQHKKSGEGGRNQVKNADGKQTGDHNLPVGDGSTVTPPLSTASMISKDSTLMSGVKKGDGDASREEENEVEETQDGDGSDGSDGSSDGVDDNDEESIVVDVVEGTFGAELLQLITETQEENKKKKMTLDEKLQAGAEGDGELILDEEDYMQLMADVVDRDGGLDEGLEYWELKHAGLGDIILNSINSVQSTAKMLHKSRPEGNVGTDNVSVDNSEKDNNSKDNAEKKAAKKVISRTVTSLINLAPLKMGSFDQKKKDDEEADLFQAQMEERRKKYLDQRKTPKLSRKHSLFMEEGSDLDSDDDDSHVETKRPFSVKSCDGTTSLANKSSTIGEDSLFIPKKGVRDIENMTQTEIEKMLEELADDASLASVPENSPPLHLHGRPGSKKQNLHLTSSGGGTPMRKRRFKDLIWGRAGQHMQQTSKQVDPLMKIMREEAELIGAEMMEEQFGVRYSRKSKWEAVEHARQLEKRRIKQEKALQKAVALL